MPTPCVNNKKMESHDSYSNSLQNIKTSRDEEYYFNYEAKLAKKMHIEDEIY